ncbi:MAG TPA: pyridoxine 5'-phosphate synthase, partial [Acetobacteraceae bacterium]
MARLSVNLNKVALLRNSRHTGVPDLLAFARAVIAAGAAGITVHPRPDERQIRRSDVPALAALLAPMRGIELNVEGFPDARLLAIADETRPAQCTLVP